MDPITNIVGMVYLVFTTNFSEPFLPPQTWNSVTNYNLPKERVRVGLVSRSEVIEFTRDGKSYSAANPTTTKLIKKVIQIGEAKEEIEWKEERVVEDYTVTKIENQIVSKSYPTVKKAKKAKKWWQFWKYESVKNGN